MDPVKPQGGEGAKKRSALGRLVSSWALAGPVLPSTRPPSPVLFFDADEARRQRLQLALRAEGVEVVGAATAEALDRELARGPFAALVVVLPEPGLDLRGLSAGGRRAATVVIAPSAQRLRWLRAGADEVVDAATWSTAELLQALESAEARRAGTREGSSRTAVALGAATRAAPALIGQSQPMASLQAKLKRVAPHAASVMLFGESGTGKELAARALHAWSQRADGPFVAVNAAAIPATLFESTLFGHARGAFTDAVRDRAGFFEEADGGTLFLDEVADLPLASQVKLLRVLEDQSIRRVGENEERRVNVRIVAATARELEQEARQGRFRDDLLFRLGGLTLRLPPLRERREDIPGLAEHFVAKINARLGTHVRGLSGGALDRLLSHPWPGNVRELENCLERAVVLCEGDVVDVQDLPEKLWPASFLVPDAASATEGAPSPAGAADRLALRSALARTERDLIRQALAESAGKRAEAARLLGVSHRTLLYKLKEHGFGADETGAPATTKRRVS